MKPRRRTIAGYPVRCGRPKGGKRVCDRTFAAAHHLQMIGPLSAADARSVLGGPWAEDLSDAIEQVIEHTRQLRRLVKPQTACALCGLCPSIPNADQHDGAHTTPSRRQAGGPTCAASGRQ
ncbi:MAG: hypothetical protein ACE149_17625 [Armatimonadota bacterium]